MSTAIIKLEFSPLSGEELLQWKPVFEADRRLKDPLKISEDLAIKEQRWLADVGNHTFTTKLTAIGGNIYNRSDGILITNRPDLVYFSSFYFTSLEETEIYAKLLEVIDTYDIRNLVWHGVDKYNLKIHLLSIKHQMKKVPFFEEVLFSYEKSNEAPGKNILLENLQKYFDIKPIKSDTYPSSFWDEVSIISQIHERRI